MHMSVGDSLIVTALGTAVVFAVLVVLNLMIKWLSMLVEAAGWGKEDWSHAHGTFIPAPGLLPEAETAPAPAAAAKDPGASGELKLYGVDEGTAAMIMAIVAYRSETPLNELRFRSIRKTSD